MIRGGSLPSSASASSRKLRAFVRWMRENDIEYTDALAFNVGSTVADIGVKALCDLQEGDVIATIPKQSCLTVKTTMATDVIEKAELGGGLGLAVALMYERSQGGLSRWYAYLQLLPFQQMLPIVWSPAEVDDLLGGTELHEVIKEDRRLIQQDWHECYAILSELHGNKFPAEWFTLDHYLAAKTLVDSRAFEVDEHHGFGMVPLADLFNHKTAAEDVHFTSVYGDSDSDQTDDLHSPCTTSNAFVGHRQERQGNVCEEVLDEKVSMNGESMHESIRETEDVKGPLHDGGEMTAGSPSDWEGNSSVLEMILVREVAKGSEIFNTYGALSNAALLHRYGFTESNNPFDIVNVELDRVRSVCFKTGFTHRHIRRRISIWRKAGCTPCNSQGSEYFEIAVGGKPQTELLMLLYMIHLSDEACLCLDMEDGGYKTEDRGEVEKIARALGWSRDSQVPRRTDYKTEYTSGISRKRRRQSIPEPVEVAADNLSRAEFPDAFREDSGTWISDLDRWLLTKPVCESLIAILRERDSLYLAIGSTVEPLGLKVTGGLATSSSPEDDKAMLQRISCEGQPKFFHALGLRVSERVLIQSCAACVSQRLKDLKRSSSP